MDPREARWEIDGQVYRVDFWAAPSHPEGAWACSEVQLTGVNSVAEVLDWSSSRAEGRDVVIYLELDEQPGAAGAGRGLVRLHGRGPDADATT